MVDDMLVLARADAEGFPVHATRVFLDEVVSDCVASFATIAAQRGVALECVVEPDVLGVADGDRVRQLLTNLVDNALKHTPRGGHVVVTLAVDGRDAVCVVADDGRGVAAADAERIFERFTRLSDGSDDASGAGLGLPIARWIAKVHGGSLTLDPTTAAGCRFVARLPVLLPPPLRASPVAGGSPAIAGALPPAHGSERARPA
jgi:two-component system sensor histidine kinase BaeS